VAGRGKMIAIKTQMKRMPERCGECQCFLSGGKRKEPVCAGTVGFGFREMTYKPPQENPKRPFWCPLVEVEQVDP